MTSPFSGGDIGIYNGVTPDTNVNSLVWRGFKWGQDGAGTQATVTFSFPSAGASWINDYFDQEPFDTFQPFTLAQQAAARNALALWSDVANITFVEVPDTPSDVGDIRFGNSGKVTNSPYFAWGCTFRSKTMEVRLLRAATSGSTRKPHRISS